VIGVGEELAGYRIEAVAGEGQTATVYEATRLSFGLRVALKIVPATGALESHEAREHARRAARRASALEHEHIITVFEDGDAGAWMFIAMRFVDGPTLADRIGRGDLDVRESLRILGATAAALDAAHEAGLVHGDVKPSNILLTAEGHPYLTDFGMAGGQATPASDVRALAAVLEDCLGGATAEIDEVVARGMARRPKDRYRTAGELVAACEAAIAELPDGELGAARRRRPPASDDAEGVRPTAASAHPPAPSSTRASAPSVARPSEASAAGPSVPSVARLSEPFVARLSEPSVARLSEPSAAGPSPPADAGPASRRGAGREEQPKPYVPPLPTPEEEAAELEAKLARRRFRAASIALPAGLRRPLAVAAAGAVLLVPVLLGYALGGEDSGPSEPKAKRSASDSVTLTVPRGWHAADVEFTGLRLDAPIGLRHAGRVELATGRLRDPAAGLDPTRERLRATIVSPRKEVVRIAGRRALRYAGERAAGGSAWLLLLPDSEGWTVVACRGPDRASLDKLCGRLAGTLEPADATPVELGPDGGLGDTLRDKLRALSKARGAAHDRLRARSANKRTRAAATLADATANAAEELDDADVRTQDVPLVDDLVAALRREAKALDRLSSAARRNDRAAYRRRRNAVRRADKAVVHVLRALRQGGYEVTVKAA
jgi:tRNA A-37 threonylcarbamoyl transferase component Bud32